MTYKIYTERDSSPGFYPPHVSWPVLITDNRAEYVTMKAHYERLLQAGMIGYLRCTEGETR